ncbi:metallophosphoesterase family protein [Pseudoflavonifractor capillosus]|uniref:metallophosphoesterase family protein n=1 Tax=Pseudoflavonifractor capillosus TaxID=106588 RepID=UPI001959257A|nr:metallophosphoesterase family protein [Pseudoflavonifractor capillosus]MBM6693250.1 metallophosphoesterase family protein [Pseudoflavonifractor capillosus]
MKLAILSDTHGLLRPQVVEHLKTADAILHGGDINKPAIVEQLQQYAPLYIVRGNNDKEWAEDIPHNLTVTLEGITFFMVHNKKEVPADLSGVNVVVFGHSHKYVQEEKDGLLWLNPGSCGPRRFHQEITMMMAEIEGGTIQVEKIDIPHETL